MQREILSDSDVHRYSRQLILPHFGREAQEKLKASRVLVVGAGGLGSPALQYLAASGVGTLGIMDADVVDISNLQRQVLYAVSDEGKPKALCARDRLQSMNPHITVQAITERLTRDNALEYIPMYDLVLDGSDNFATRYLVNDACVIAGKPFVYGAIHQYEGQVSLFNYKGGPTYRCLFPMPSADPLPACSEAGVLGVLPGITGTWQACEAIKALTGVGEVLSGKLLLFDLFHLENQVLEFDLHPENLAITHLPDEDPLFCSLPADCEEMLPKHLQAMLNDQKDEAAPMQLLDVREEAEFSADSHLGGIHIPLTQLQDRLHEINPNHDTLVYCQIGMRSSLAAGTLRSAFPRMRILHLKGGLLAYHWL